MPMLLQTGPAGVVDLVSLNATRSIKKRKMLLFAFTIDRVSQRGETVGPVYSSTWYMFIKEDCLFSFFSL